ncbi:lipopolysaccharide biosynthesis protein, partial [Methylosinus sp. R-45379]|uniref:lipopolysaccharide biosynthesis protein n=1 Tax=Methylosinus sp. R-45379 TaxID=980563 RepID=UPI000AB46E10
FLGIQIVVAINVASDNLIISKMLGPEAVTAFSVPERMFGLVPMLIHLALQPLWPAYAEARARQDDAWVKNTLRRAFVNSLVVSSACCSGLVLLGQWIVEHWTAGVAVPTLVLLGGLALWKVVDSIEYSLTSFLSSAGALRPQLLYGFMAMSTALLGKVLLIPAVGLEVVPWVSAISRVIWSSIPLLFLSRSLAKS